MKICTLLIHLLPWSNNRFSRVSTVFAWTPRWKYLCYTFDRMLINLEQHWRNLCVIWGTCFRSELHRASKCPLVPRPAETSRRRITVIFKIPSHELSQFCFFFFLFWHVVKFCYHNLSLLNWQLNMAEFVIDSVCFLLQSLRLFYQRKTNINYFKLNPWTRIPTEAGWTNVLLFFGILTPLDQQHKPQDQQPPLSVLIW